jgi:nicotinate-nucleotide adenylyltransferase
MGRGIERHGTPRVAFFGGTFDPPHLGHLAVARAAKDALHLDTVLFAPVGAQPLKPEGSTATFADRLEMVRLATAADPDFAVSMADAPRPNGRPNYTLDTLRRLRAELPATGELFCLMGADSIANLRAWHGAVEIPFAASLVVASRPGQSLEDLGRLLPDGLRLAPCKQEDADKAPVELRTCTVTNVSGATATLYVLPGIDIPISATEVRSNLRAGKGSAPVPAVVAQFIRDHALYR